MSRWSFRGIEGQGICDPDGECIARIGDVLWDPVEQRVLAFKVQWLDAEARSHGPSEDLPLSQIRRAAASAFECAPLPQATAGLDAGLASVGLAEGGAILGASLTDVGRHLRGRVVDVHFLDDDGAIVGFELADGSIWPPLSDLEQVDPGVWRGRGKDGTEHPVHGDSGPGHPRARLAVNPSEIPDVDDTTASWGTWGEPLQEQTPPRVE